jgi:predicted amidohydrolase YtcJ
VSALTEGKLADFVVLSRDPLSIPERELDSVKVEMTVAGGRVVFAAAR